VDELQQQVTFRFGVDADVRYLHELPEIGDFVSHRNDLWVVTSIQVSSLGALVSCEPTRADVTSDEQARRATL
jgi:hypothetical protein